MRGRHLDVASPCFVGGAKIEPLDQSVVCSSFGPGNSKNSGLLFPRTGFFLLLLLLHHQCRFMTVLLA